MRHGRRFHGHLARRLLVAVVASFMGVASSQAQEPADFRSSAELDLVEPGGLHRFVLPFEAYRDARRDLSDLRVFNGAGQPVAFALALEEDRAPTIDTVALRQFAVFGSGGESPADLDVSVRTRSDGAVISVQPRGRANPSTSGRPAAWLLDASAIERPLRALMVEWDAGPGAEVVHVSVESSDDLRRWRPVVARAALVRAQQGEQVLAQPRVEFAPRQARYWRIAATDPSSPFVLRAVRAETRDGATPLPRETREYAGVAGAEPGERVFDLGARLPVEAVRVVFGEPNTVARIEILSRDSEDDEWRPVMTGDFYRLIRDGADVTSPATDMLPRAHRFWMLRVDPRSGEGASDSLALAVSWRPAHVVFVAGGEPPFSVAFGNPDAPRARADLPVTGVIPDYTRNAEYRLPEASVGEVRTVALRGDNLRSLVGDVSARTVALWGVLFAGVAFLGFMAWRLSRQLPGG